MKEAVLYEKLSGDQVRCNLCSHRCTIFPGNRGICAVRENREGTLYTLNYGLLVDATPDPVEKKPFYHYLPGSYSFSICSVGCNFRCMHCLNWHTSQAPKGPDGQIFGEEIEPEKVVEAALRSGCESIAYTYTEPTVFFEYVRDTAILAKKKGLKNLFVTNGFQTSQTIEKMVGIIDAANVDLKAFSEEFYHRVCGAHLQPVLDAIKLMYERGIFIEVTTVLIPGENDDEKEIRKLAEFLFSISPDIPWHVSRFAPNYKMLDVSPTPIKKLQKAYDIGKKVGLNYIYVWGPGRDLPGGVFAIGDTVCPKCGKVVVGRSLWQPDLSGLTKGGNCRYCGEEIPIIL